MSNKIVFENVTKRFDEVLALDALSFEIPTNKIVGLIGANGAGKTTILRHIIKYLRPDSGIIQIDGKDIYRFTNEMYPVSFVPDSPIYYEELTVAEHLCFISSMYETKKRVPELISALELNKHLNKVPGALSKGTLQKVMIACALLRTHDVFIADEPFSGLDPKQIIVLKDLLLKEKAEGKTIIVSTHLLAMIESLCDYYVFIDNGKLLSQGQLDQLTISGKATTLEDIYMTLSKDSDDNISG